MEIEGRPAIAHLLDRLFASQYLEPSRVVVCTTQDPSDDALVPVVEATGARVFRGSRDNIIDRFHQAARSFGFDVVVQADGDDPCVDPLYMDFCVEALLADEALDIVVADGLPLGLASKAFRRSALDRVWAHHTTDRNDTGFIYYFTRTGLCEVGTVTAGPKHRHATARLTLDHVEDLAFFRALFAELYVPDEVFGVEEIVSLLERCPELLALNAGLDERYWSRTRELSQLEYRVDGEIYKVSA
jgi:spore coat polysaccharide biosynthesis protein SpsF (cytidylyltransferase family)